MVPRGDRVLLIPGRAKPLVRPRVDAYLHALDSLNWLACSLDFDLAACEALQKLMTELEAGLASAAGRAAHRRRHKPSNSHRALMLARAKGGRHNG